MEDESLILDKLNMIKAQITKIAEHLDDVTLTTDDIISIREAEEDLKKGRTKRL